MWVKIRQLFIDHEQKIVLAVGLVLVAAVSFQAGILKGRQIQEKPMIIEKPADAVKAGDSQTQSSPQAQNLAPDALKVSEAVNKLPQDCAFVGSKNSNKYHLPTCSYAKKIKPENIACFKSVEDAVARGYQPDKGCVK